MPHPQSYVPKTAISCTMALVGASSATECLSTGVEGIYLEADTTGELVRVGFSDIRDPGTRSGLTITLDVSVTGGGAEWLPVLVRAIDARAGGDVVLWSAVVLAQGTWKTYAWELPADAMGQLSTFDNLQVDVTLAQGAPAHTARIRQLKTDNPGVVELRVTRMAYDVLGEARAPRLLVTRMASEVLGAAASPRLLVSLMSLEVLGKASPKLNVTRMALEALGVARDPFLNVTRMAFEVLGRNVYGVVVSPANLPVPPPNFVMANWTGEVVLETTYSTGVLTAESGAEDRRINFDRPYRTQHAQLTGLRRGEAARIYFNLFRLAQTRSVQPLYSDRAKTTAPSSATTIWCDPSLRRFSNGMRVVIHTWGADGRPANVAYAICLVVQTDQLQLAATTPLPITYPTGSAVYPVMDVELALESDGQYITDELVNVQLQSTEIIGPGALFPTATDIPDGVQSSGGLAIFDLPVDWRDGIQPGAQRDGERFESGKSFFSVARGERARLTIPLRMTFTSRAAAWRAIQFFDYARGRGKAYYLVAPEELFAATVMTQTQVDVEAVGNFEDAQLFVRYLTIERTDGMLVVVAVTSCVNNGATWTFLFLDPGVSISLATTRRVALSHKCRMATDTMTERWTTDELCTVEYAAVELLREQSFPLTDLTESFQFVASPQAIPNLWGWWDSSVNVWKKTGGANDADRFEIAALADPVGVWDLADLASPPVSGRPYAIWLDFPTSESQVMHLTSYLSPAFNSGRPALGVFSNNDGLQALGAEDFVDNSAGLTIFYCTRQTDVTQTSTSLNQSYTFFKRTGVIEWGKSQIKLFNTLDTVDTNLWLSGLPDLRTGELMILAFRWEPGVSAKLYKGGLVIGSAATAPSGLPNAAATGRKIELMFAGGAGAVFPYSDSIAIEVPTLNAIAIYKRALSSAEMNSLGNYFKNRFGGHWTNVP